MVVIAVMIAGCGAPTPVPAPPAQPAEAQPTTPPAAPEPTKAPEAPAAPAAPAAAIKGPATVANMQGIAPGKYPNQYEVAEYEAASGGKMEFSGRAKMDDRLIKIFGDIPADVKARLPEEPLVEVPYSEIGKYGGELEGLSLGPESGNSEYLSWRHANLIRYAEDLETIVPNLVKDFSVSDDLKTFTFTLRKGHKWSDGQPFTSDDVLFWWEDIMLNKELTPEVPEYWTFGGEPMKVEKVDDQTFKFITAAPAPGMLPWLASTWILPAAPKHFLQSKMLKYNPDINAEATAEGKTSWVDYFFTWYGEWADSTHRKGVIPRLEAWVLVEETTEYQLMVANPFYFKVDTAGQQLPYADQSRETYSQDSQVITLKVINGEVDEKAQTLAFQDVPVYKQHEPDGKYKVTLSPSGADGMVVAFNCTDKDPVLQALFSKPEFNYAMSMALDRKEFNKVNCLGQCEEISTGVPIHPSATFAKPEWYTYKTEYNVDEANKILDSLGLDKKDSEGFHLRSDGKRLVVAINYTIQSISAEAINLVKSYWEAVGVKVETKEIATEQYRALATGNDLDVASFTSGSTLEPTFIAKQYRFYPPFGDAVLEPICGLAYNQWLKTAGKEGTEPPADMKRLYELAQQFKTLIPGSPEYIKAGQEIGDIHMKNMYIIGIIGPSPSVQIARDRVGNYMPAKITAFEYYREYPYKPDQWFIKE